MYETAKTLIFLALACALVAGAFFSRPVPPELKVEEMVGQPLFPQFTDPLAIKSLEIVKLNAAGERNDFRITEVNGVWSIPSHDNYPADAKDQMGSVAEALTGLTVLEVIQPEESGIDTIAFQTQYGVIDPASEHTLIAEAVGTKITLGGANNETLVNLIIGKTAARSQSLDLMGEDEANLRYARIGNQAPVYVIDIDPRQFSTNFDQWIEKNLLDISTFDIKEIYVDEYSFAVELTLTNLGLREVGRPTFVGDITLEYDGSAVGADKWSLNRWMVFEKPNDDYKERQLESDKELNTDTLDAMVSALGDLKIVSVLKKPTELAAALRAGTSFDQIARTVPRTVLTSMMELMQETGFWLIQMPDMRGSSEEMKVQLLSNEGDIQLRLKDGIVYKFRFGELTGTESEALPEQFDSMGSPTRMTPNRYLFVTAEFDPAMIPLPESKPVPENSEEAEAVMRANQREQERYVAAVESGKKRVSELSNRFADWYYVISDDVYKNIHLTESNVFRFRTPGGEPSWGNTILEGLDFSNLGGTSPAEHVRDLPVVPGLELEQTDKPQEPAPQDHDASEDVL